jgi:hypothetical protein
MREYNEALVGLSLCLALAGCRQHGDSSQSEHSGTPPPLPSATAPTNPVQHEMQLLTSALERAVRAIGLGEVRGIAHDLHQVHAAKQATDAAIRGGNYRLPKNPERVDRFGELDAAFHGHLERLVKASNTNDVAGTSAAFAAAMHACQGCHAEFRR